MSSGGSGVCRSVAKNCSSCDVASCATSALPGRRPIPTDGSRVGSAKVSLVDFGDGTAANCLSGSSSTPSPCSTRLGAVHINKVRPAPPAPRFSSFLAFGAI